MQYIGNDIVRNDGVASCYFTEEHNCSSLTCPVDSGVDLTIFILRCAHPPAIRMAIGSRFERLFDHTFNHSEILPITDSDGALNVTLIHLCPSGIGFQVSNLLHKCGSIKKNNTDLFFCTCLWSPRCNIVPLRHRLYGVVHLPKVL